VGAVGRWCVYLVIQGGEERGVGTGMEL